MIRKSVMIILAVIIAMVMLSIESHRVSLRDHCS